MKKRTLIVIAPFVVLMFLFLTFDAIGYDYQLTLDPDYINETDCQKDINGKAPIIKATEPPMGRVWTQNPYLLYLYTGEKNVTLPDYPSKRDPNSPAIKDDDSVKGLIYGWLTCGLDHNVPGSACHNESPNNVGSKDGYGGIGSECPQATSKGWQNRIATSFANSWALLAIRPQYANRPIVASSPDELKDAIQWTTAADIDGNLGDPSALRWKSVSMSPVKSRDLHNQGKYEGAKDTFLKSVYWPPVVVTDDIIDEVNNNEVYKSRTNNTPWVSTGFGLDGHMGGHDTAYQTVAGIFAPFFSPMTLGINEWTSNIPTQFYPKQLTWAYEHMGFIGSEETYYEGGEYSNTYNRKVDYDPCTGEVCMKNGYPMFTKYWDTDEEILSPNSDISEKGCPSQDNTTCKIKKRIITSGSLNVSESLIDHPSSTWPFDIEIGPPEPWCEEAIANGWNWCNDHRAYEPKQGEGECPIGLQCSKAAASPAVPNISITPSSDFKGEALFISSVQGSSTTAANMLFKDISVPILKNIGGTFTLKANHFTGSGKPIVLANSGVTNIFKNNLLIKNIPFETTGGTINIIGNHLTGDTPVIIKKGPGCSVPMLFHNNTLDKWPDKLVQFEDKGCDGYLDTALNKVEQRDTNEYGMTFLGKELNNTTTLTGAAILLDKKQIAFLCAPKNIKGQSYTFAKTKADEYVRSSKSGQICDATSKGYVSGRTVTIGSELLDKISSSNNITVLLFKDGEPFTLVGYGGAIIDRTKIDHSECIARATQENAFSTIVDVTAQDCENAHICCATSSVCVKKCIGVTGCTALKRFFDSPSSGNAYFTKAQERCGADITYEEYIKGYQKAFYDSYNRNCSFSAEEFKQYDVSQNVQPTVANDDFAKKCESIKGSIEMKEISKTTDIKDILKGAIEPGSIKLKPMPMPGNMIINRGTMIKDMPKNNK